jgi:hypothetical protein
LPQQANPHLIRDIVKALLSCTKTPHTSGTPSIAHFLWELRKHHHHW